MSRFVVYGPCALKLCPESKGKKLSRPEKQFWKDYEEYQGMLGCYVFGIRTRGDCFKPYYVGLTTRSFKEEIFTGHKIDHYNNALKDCKRGQPVLFFVAYATMKGKVSRKAVRDVEAFLIQNGVSVNPLLTNIRSTKKATWIIDGVVRSTAPGRRSKSAATFASMMGLAG